VQIPGWSHPPEPVSRERLPDGFWLPVLLQLDEQEVVTQLVLGEKIWIGLEVFVDESPLAVVTV